MKSIFKSILTGFITIIAFSGCNKWLDVQPSDQISDADLFKDASGFRNALNGVFQDMSSQNLYGRQLTWGIPSVLARDYNMDYVTNEYWYLSENNMTQALVVTGTTDVWSTAFRTIANCNKILTEIQLKDSSFFPLKQIEKNLIIGEALAARAMLHFEMLRLYAPSPARDRVGKFIPYQVDYPSHAATPLSATDLVKNIVKDLDSAKELVVRHDTILNRVTMSGKLQSLFTGGSANTGGVFFNFRMHRMNFVAIHTLLARVHLYNGDFVNAKKSAEYVYKEFGPTGRLKWWAFTTEANSKGANRFPKLVDDIIMAAYDPNLVSTMKTFKGTYYTFKLSDEVLKPGSVWFPAAEPREHRLNLVSTGFSDKLNESLSTAQNVPQQNFIYPIMRMSEIYYMYAECLFKENDVTGALRILNEMRYARGATNAFTGTSSEAFYQELLLEYRREYLAEGQTLFAHKRLNMPIVIGTQRIEMDNRMVLPIPAGEKIF